MNIVRQFPENIVFYTAGKRLCFRYSLYTSVYEIVNGNTLIYHQFLIRNTGLNHFANVGKMVSKTINSSYVLISIILSARLGTDIEPFLLQQERFLLILNYY